MASIYPLQWIAQQVAGSGNEVSALTPPGSEPHDVELAQSDVIRLVDADLLVTLDGFQPAVDDAARDMPSARVLDVTGVVDLLSNRQGAGSDPHFWLDPTRLSRVADTLARRFGQLHPDGAVGYRARAARVVSALTGLDRDIRKGLRTCDQRSVVTSHTAFAYLADRYDLTQVGVSGINAEAEPSPSRQAEVVDLIERTGVTTVYVEAGAAPGAAESVAQEAGVSIAVLDPVERDPTGPADYLDAMRSNLAALVAGQGCT